MASDARQTALQVLQRVDRGGYADRSLDSALRRGPSDPRDRALTTELVYGVLRLRNRLDFALTRLVDQPLAKLEPPVLRLLRLGAYQILELDRVPAPAAVHETVELAKRSGLQRAAGLINAVLRRLIREGDRLPWPDPARDPVAHLTWRLSLPAWLARRWHRELGGEAAELAASLLQPAPFTLRTNTLKISRPDLLAELAAAGHEARPTGYAPEGIIVARRSDRPLPGDAEGWYQVQDEASMLIAPLLTPQAGESLLDACAAPGGKTTHLAALTGNRVQVTALDLHPHRVALIDQGLRRLGCARVQTAVCDLTRPSKSLVDGQFDGVLVDAPCSGLGVLRRNPEARWRLQPADLADLHQRQAALLAQAARLTRPGGRLVYSVCTVTAEETEHVLTDFLARHPDFTLSPLGGTLPEACHSLLDDQGRLRTWPHRQGLDGFFAARLVRR